MKGTTHNLLDHALSQCKCDEAEATLLQYDTALTRFASNSIHQNVTEQNALLTIRAIVGKRTGVAWTNDLSPEGIRSAAERAVTAARVVPDNPELPPLPEPSPIPKVDGFDVRTAETGPQERASAVRVVCRKAEGAGLVASGAFSTGSYTFAVANTKGVRAEFARTLADLSVVMLSDTSAGYAHAVATDVGAIDAEALASEAIDRAVRGKAPIEVPPGVYEVVLEPYAVSDMLDFLGYVAFNAQTVQEKRSFMAGRLGQQVMSERISIWDDGLDPSGIVTPFDFEGVPKQRVDFIVKGVANSVCHDSQTAAKEGRRSTGHALAAGSTTGPMPTNLFMAPGGVSLKEMIASVKRGLLVTRFWYTRVVHPLQVVMTGTTRDGTFLIENGEVTRPVKNLRFTQSYLTALNQVEAVSRETRLERAWLSFNRVPALRIAQWNFTGATTY